MNKLWQQLSDWLLGETNYQSVKEESIREGYQDLRPSLADHWGIADFCDQHDVFLLNDGHSMGSGFEVGDVAAENYTPRQLEKLFNKVCETLNSVVPLYPRNPWVMQVYLQDDFDSQPVIKHIEAKIDEKYRDSAFTQDHIKKIAHLLKLGASSQGLFIDPKTDKPYRFRRRRIRLLFYRRLDPENTRSHQEALNQHLATLGEIESKLQSPGLKIKRMKGRDYYHWWLKWFNPNNAEELINAYPYSTEKPAAYHFIQNVLFSAIESDEKGFLIDGMRHRVVYLEGLKQVPTIGALSKEQVQSHPKHRYALLDQLPEGSIYSLQIVFNDDSDLNAHLLGLEKGIVGNGLYQQQVKSDIKNARDEASQGNRLYWANQAIFYRLAEDEDIEGVENTLRSIFSEAKLSLIESKHDFHPLSSYLNALPFNFDPHYARQYLSVDRLMYASEVAALLPIYGRFQGDKSQGGLCFFNRLGEPVFFDLLHENFVSQNSHCAIFANSGGGKSVLTGWLIQSLIASQNARIVLFEMGNSFDRLLLHCKHFGKHTRQLVLSNNSEQAVALNPFCDAYRALPELASQLSESHIEHIQQRLIDSRKAQGEPAPGTDLNCDDKSRCILAEMALALRTMITEANPKEEQDFSLADETLLIEILADTITTSAEAGTPQVLTEHVLQAFAKRCEIETNPKKKERQQEMHDRLKSYVINQQKARFFNVASEPLDDFDIFHIDVGAIKDDKGKLALVMISLLPRILAIAEASQNDPRPMFLIIDEAHLQFEIDVIVSYATLIAKVARKLGLWMIPVTQNISDMNSAKATKILSLMETWIVLGLDEKEIEHIQQFKALSDEQKTLIRQIDSHKGLFSEAVLLGARHQGLFRVIPPRYLLALLMNEKQEKAERSLLEEKHGVLKAAEIMAKKLEQPRRMSQVESHFYEE